MDATGVDVANGAICCLAGVGCAVAVAAATVGVCVGVDVVAVAVAAVPAAAAVVDCGCGAFEQVLRLRAHPPGCDVHRPDHMQSWFRIGGNCGSSNANKSDWTSK